MITNTYVKNVDKIPVAGYAQDTIWLNAERRNMTFTVQDLVLELMKYPIDAAVVVDVDGVARQIKLACGHALRRRDDGLMEVAHKGYELRHKAKVVAILPDTE